MTGLGARMTADSFEICELAVQGIPGIREGTLSGSVRIGAGAAGRGWLALGDLPHPPRIDFSLWSPQIVPALPTGTVTDLILNGRLDDLGLDVSELRGSLDYGPFCAA